MAVALRCATLFVTLAGLLPCPVEGKLQAGSVRVGGTREEQHWHYLSKFGYAIGSGTYEVRLRLRRPPADGSEVQVNMDVFLDEDWAHVEALPSCARQADARRTHFDLVLGATPGEWGPWQGGEVYQVMRPHIWYFALSDCRGGSRGNAALYDLDFEVRMKQFDESELSIEMRYMPAVSALALLCLSAFLVRFAARCRSLRESAGQVHPVVRGLATAVGLQWGAQALHALHLVAYRGDGVGLHMADTMGEVLFMLSQVVSSTLLIAIAWGYTLLRAKVGDLGPVRSIAAAAVVLHAFLVALGKLQGDASHKYHENEGAVGWVLLAVRLGLYSWFMAGVQVLRERGGFRLHSFLARFEIAGSVYFLSYPVIFIIAQVFAQYLQHPVMQVGLLAMQTASALWLADLFLSRGAFFEASSLSSSLLPGGTGGYFSVALKKEE